VILKSISLSSSPKTNVSTNKTTAPGWIRMCPRAMLVVAIILPTIVSAQPDQPRAEFTQAMWATTEALYTPTDVERLISVAYACNFNAIYLQVRRAGDAYYVSETEPRSRKLEGQPDDYDPLAYAVELAGLFDIEIHAWLNVNYAWPGPEAPPAPEHIANRHPEWVLVGRDGRRMTSYSRAQMSGLDAEGWYLDPAAPGFADYFAGVAVEVAAAYDVDGVHLDFIRYPNFRFGYSRENRNAFSTERGDADPLLYAYQYVEEDIFRPAYGAGGLANRWLDLHSLEWWDWRADSVTTVVKTVRDAVKAERPDCVISAAVWQQPEHAYRYVGQEWLLWTEKGYVDTIIPMAYWGAAPALVTLDDRVAGRCAGGTERLMGIGVFNHDDAYAADVCEALYESSAQGVVLFDYLSCVREPEILSAVTEEALAEDLATAGRRDDRWYRKWYAVRP
jgi:uncharacterized lipoprotein YddW (UPF0748 family)